MSTPDGYCEWTQDGEEDSDTWAAACGHYFMLNEGDPLENSFAYCPYCGSPIAVTPLVWDPKCGVIYGETKVAPTDDKRTPWIDCAETLPDDGDNVAFIADGYNYGGRILGGSYRSGVGFTVPGLALDATHWMPLPEPPAECRERGEE